MNSFYDNIGYKVLSLPNKEEQKVSRERLDSLFAPPPAPFVQDRQELKPSLGSLRHQNREYLKETVGGYQNTVQGGSRQTYRATGNQDSQGQPYMTEIGAPDIVGPRYGSASSYTPPPSKVVTPPPPPPRQPPPPPQPAASAPSFSKTNFDFDSDMLHPLGPEGTRGASTPADKLNMERLQVPKDEPPAAPVTPPPASVTPPPRVQVQQPAVPPQPSVTPANAVPPSTPPAPVTRPPEVTVSPVHAVNSLFPEPLGPKKPPQPDQVPPQDKEEVRFGSRPLLSEPVAPPPPPAAVAQPPTQQTTTYRPPTFSNGRPTESFFPEPLGPAKPIRRDVVPPQQTEVVATFGSRPLPAQQDAPAPAPPAAVVAIPPSPPPPPRAPPSPPVQPNPVHTYTDRFVEKLFPEPLGPAKPANPEVVPPQQTEVVAFGSRPLPSPPPEAYQAPPATPRATPSPTYMPPEVESIGMKPLYRANPVRRDVVPPRNTEEVSFGSRPLNPEPVRPPTVQATGAPEVGSLGMQPLGKPRPANPEVVPPRTSTEVAFGSRPVPSPDTTSYGYNTYPPMPTPGSSQVGPPDALKQDVAVSKSLTSPPPSSSLEPATERVSPDPRGQELDATAYAKSLFPETVPPPFVQQHEHQAQQVAPTPTPPPPVSVPPPAVVVGPAAVDPPATAAPVTEPPIAPVATPPTPLAVSPVAVEPSSQVAPVTSPVQTPAEPVSVSPVAAEPPTQAAPVASPVQTPAEAISVSPAAAEPPAQAAPVASPVQTPAEAIASTSTPLPTPPIATSPAPVAVPEPVAPPKPVDLPPSDDVMFERKQSSTRRIKKMLQDREAVRMAPVPPVSAHAASPASAHASTFEGRIAYYAKRIGEIRRIREVEIEHSFETRIAKYAKRIAVIRREREAAMPPPPPIVTFEDRIARYAARIQEMRGCQLAGANL